MCPPNVIKYIETTQQQWILLIELVQTLVVMTSDQQLVLFGTHK